MSCSDRHEARAGSERQGSSGGADSAVRSERGLLRWQSQFPQVWKRAGFSADVPFSRNTRKNRPNTTAVINNSIIVSSMISSYTPRGRNLPPRSTAVPGKVAVSSVVKTTRLPLRGPARTHLRVRRKAAAFVLAQFFRRWLFSSLQAEPVWDQEKTRPSGRHRFNPRRTVTPLRLVRLNLLADRFEPLSDQQLVGSAAGSV